MTSKKEDFGFSANLSNSTKRVVHVASTSARDTEEAVDHEIIFSGRTLASIKHRLTLFSAHTGIKQKEGLTEALDEYLKRKGF